MHSERLMNLIYHSVNNTFLYGAGLAEYKRFKYTPQRISSIAYLLYDRLCALPTRCPYIKEMNRTFHMQLNGTTETETERERERERQGETETERQRQRETDRDKETETETEREREREGEQEIAREILLPGQSHLVEVTDEPSCQSQGPTARA
jgi:hypothetical protein